MGAEGAQGGAAWRAGHAQVDAQPAGRVPRTRHEEVGEGERHQRLMWGLRSHVTPPHRTVLPVAAATWVRTRGGASRSAWRSKVGVSPTARGSCLLSTLFH